MGYETDYKLLCEQMEEMLNTEYWYVSAMSNAAALLWQFIPDINWAGFYVLRHGCLHIGPFQGKPACIHISSGKGVCGTALEKDEVQLVPDVHRFPGHITCDAVSSSEIVIPIHRKDSGTVKAVLDIDSPLKDRFSEEDRKGLESFCRILEDKLIWQ